MLSEDFGLASIDLANSYAVSMTGGLKNISGELTGGPDGRLFTYEADNGKLSEVLIDASYSMQLISTLNVLVSTLATLVLSVALIIVAMKLYEREKILFGTK
jgi:hypothetical protein